MYEAGEKYRVQIKIDGTFYYLGTFKTKKEAGVAYDQFVIDKSNKEVTYALNYPNMSDEEREKILSTQIQKKRDNPNEKTTSSNKRRKTSIVG